MTTLCERDKFGIRVYLNIKHYAVAVIIIFYLKAVVLRYNLSSKKTMQLKQLYFN